MTNPLHSLEWLGPYLAVEVGAVSGRPGHQKRLPARSTSAGTRTVRTSRVSSRTPIPTMTPIWVRAMRGRTPRTAKTAARRVPALVMTPPVDASARRMASRVRWPATVSSLVRAMREKVSLLRFDGHHWRGGQVVRAVSYSAGLR